MSDEAIEDIHDAHGLLNSYEDILDITVDFVSELGTTNMSVSELLKLEVGSVIDLRGRAWSFTSIREFLEKVKLWSMRKI